MKQKLSSRILIVLLSVVMLITALPLNSLTVFADQYTGGGSGSASVSGVSDSDLNMSGSEYGVRIYCIDKDKKIKTTKSDGSAATVCAVDLWYDTDSIKGTYGTKCRFGTIDASKISRGSFSAGVTTANNVLKSKGKLEGSNKIAGITDFAWFEGSDYVMKGEVFRDSWATQKVTTTTGDVWNVVALYSAITQINIKAGEFMVIEPLMCLPVVVGQYPDGLSYAGHYAGTWYGYMYQLQDNSGGTMMNIKAAWGNGFKLDKAKAGLSKAGRYTRSTYFNAINKTGWGLHVIETTDSFGDDTDPIDSYDIVNKPKEPDHCETPKKKTGTGAYNNTGTRTIVKTYVDLYKDKNNSNHYTAAIDSGTFIVDDCSDKVVISNEFYKTGYSVKAWYTSKSLPSADEENYKGTSMLHKSSSTTSGVGDQSYTIEGYMQMSGITANGSKSYKMQKTVIKDGKSEYKNLGTNINKNYTRTNAIQKTGSISRIKTASTSQYVKLGEDDQTIVILYVREHGYIDSSTFTETSINNDPHQELKIVKCYGVVNPATYEVENDKATQYITSKTRNVNVRDEKGYRFAEFVYCTRGSSSYSSMTASKWCQVKGDDTSKNKQFYLKGFIDGFSASPFGSGTYSSQYAWDIYNDTTHGTPNLTGERPISSDHSNGTNITISNNKTYSGTIGRGRLSGDILDGYEKTIYFGGTAMPDKTNTNTSDDVLYLLFLKDDEVEYEVGDFGIPESYITRRNNFATNNVKVGGVTGSSSKQYSFAAHQFKYS